MKYIIKVVAPLIFVLFGFNFVSALTTGLPACNQTFSESNGSLVKRSCDNGPVEYYANGVKITETEYTAKLAELNKQGVICTKNYDGNALTYDDPTTVDPNPSVFLRVVCVKDQYGAYYINNEKVTYGVFFDAYLKKVSQAFSKSSETVVQNKEAFSFMITRQECLKALSTFEQVKEKSLGTYVKFCSDPNSLTMSHGYSFYPQKSGVKVMYTKYDQDSLNTISDPTLADPVEEKKIFIAKSNENVSLSSCGLNLITSNNKLGNSNADVKNIQIVLKQAGYLKATPNGYYGNATKLAVRNFQKSIDSNGDYSSRYTLGVVNPWTAKKLNDLCKKIESQTTGQSNPSPTSASIAKPISSICTMEARMCADGSVMPRDSNCAWREDKCPQASSSSKNILPVITSFTSKVIDSSVAGKASISWSTSQSADVAIDLVCSSDYVVIVVDNGNKVSCGGRNGLGIWRGRINGTIGFSFSGNTSPATVQFVITVLDKNGQYTNQKQTTSITFPAQGNVQGNIIPSSGSVQFGPVITSMSEFTVDGLGNIVGTGFDPMSNAVTMNGVTKQLTTSAKGDVIPFYAKDFNLVEGVAYVVKVSTGSFASNSYGFTFPCRAGTVSTAWSGGALCTPIGSLLFSQTSYSATYTQGDPLPGTSASGSNLYSNTKFFQNGTIKNTSNADITYSISVLNQPLWLNSGYSKERMTLKSGQEIGLSAYLDPATVANTPGVYRTNIVISGNFTNSPVTIPVTLTVLKANPVSNLSTNPSLSVISNPSLKLSYDSLNKESGLSASFNLKVTAGKTDLKLYRSGIFDTEMYSFLINLNDSSTNKTVIANNASTNGSFSLISGDFIEKGDYVIVPAYKSATIRLTGSLSSPKILFAGRYDASVLMYKPSSADGNIYPSPLNGSAVGTNSVTVIGETSPYISSVTCDTASYVNCTIVGNRFDSTSNYIFLNNTSMSVPSSSNGTSITIQANNFGITTPGYYPLTITTAQGLSNRFLVFVSTAPVARPIDCPIGYSLSGTLCVPDTVQIAPPSKTIIPVSKSTTGIVFGVSTVCVDIPSNLHRGNESSVTLDLQKFLAEKGYLLDTPTGFYGDVTVEAVKTYQASRNIPVTGMVYEMTRASIKAETCGL